uniref:Transposon Ty3-I Gag-Pol polyprotein n=1 Tax=Cajanus cajan TaxID=3821 RepID=A0A151QW21_CAJCA|nr:Transposon Ty3-I Gag-Pol polyprotein [Cajanus cajan]
MEFIKGLPIYYGKKVIFVVVDRLSKAAHFMALSHPYTATEVAQSFMDNVFKLHGFPDSITSDRDATLYEIVYGQPPPAYLPYLLGESKLGTLPEWLSILLKPSTVLKFHLRRAQDRMKQTADKHRTDRQFVIEDLVYVKLHFYRQVSVAHRNCVKLNPKFFGPFKVLDRIGAVAYKLDLPTSSRIHPVFHVSQLQRHIGDLVSSPALPLNAADAISDKEPKAILDRATVKRGNQAVTKVLVKWKHHLLEDATGSFTMI